jgi:transposase
MAYREVTVLEIKEVVRLWLAAIAKKQIAKQLSVDPKTVRKYVRAAEAVGLRPAPDAVITDEAFAAIATKLTSRGEREHGEAWARCVEQRTFVEEHLKNRVRLSKIRRLLKRNNVEIPYSTLHRFAVEVLDFGRKAPTVPVADCGPGEEVQLDTGWVGSFEPDLTGKRRKFRAWIFTPVRSRYRFVWPCFEESTKTAIEACEAAWEFYGGVFKVVLPDNTKAIVNEPDPLSPKFSAGILEYMQARGFRVDAARVRKPRDKARVERTVRDVRDDCFGGEKLTDLRGARERAVVWCRDEYGMRRHTTTQRMPREYFEAEEKAALKPEPENFYDVPIWSDVRVHLDQHVQVQKALYSVRREFVGTTLRARADQTTVRLYDGITLLKIRPRLEAGKRCTDPEDFPEDKLGVASRDLDFLRRRGEAFGPSIGRYVGLLLAGELPWTKVRQVYALLRLVEKFGKERIDFACSTALAVDLVDVKRLKRIVEQGTTPTPSSGADRVLPLARYLRSSDQFAIRSPVSGNQQEEEGS